MSKQNLITTGNNYSRRVYIVTLISFIFIFLFLASFAMYAPGNYFQSKNGNVSIDDIIFAIILIVNDICVILSFIEFIKTCCRTFQKKSFSLKQFGEIIVGIYPSIVVLFLCNWNVSTLLHYVLAPVKILFD